MAFEIGGPPSRGGNKEAYWKRERRDQAAFQPGEKPHDIEMEKALIAGVLYSTDTFLEVQDVVKKEDFFLPQHQEIFEAINQLNFKSIPVDINTLSAYLRDQGKLDSVGGLSYISELAGSPTTSMHSIQYGKNISDLAWRRRLIEAGEACRSTALKSGDTRDIAAQIESFVFSATQEKKDSKVAKLGTLLEGAIKEFETRSEGGGEGPDAVHTGLKDLDKCLAGMRPGQLVVLAARPGMGKTSLACNIMYNVVCQEHKPTLFFSLEMTKEELVERILSFASNVDSGKLRTGDLSPEDFQELFFAAQDCQEAPLYIDDRSIVTPYDVLGTARRLQAQLALQKQGQKLGLIVVDYIQIMKGGGYSESRNLEVAAITGGLKAIAKELKVPVLALSQLNRDLAKRPGESKKPQLSDLKDSGAIEADADVVMFIHRTQGPETDSRAPSEAEIIVAKQRTGPQKDIKVTWLGHLTRFTDHISPSFSTERYGQFPDSGGAAPDSQGEGSGSAGGPPPDGPPPGFGGY